MKNAILLATVTFLCPLPLLCIPPKSVVFNTSESYRGFFGLKIEGPGSSVGWLKASVNPQNGYYVGKRVAQSSLMPIWSHNRIFLAEFTDNICQEKLGRFIAMGAILLSFLGGFKNFRRGK